MLRCKLVALVVLSWFRNDNIDFAVADKSYAVVATYVSDNSILPLSEQKIVLYEILSFKVPMGIRRYLQLIGKNNDFY